MRRAAALLAVLVATVPATALGGGRAAPKLHVVRLHPFTVKGTGFAPHKRVTLTLVAGKRWSAHANVAASGAFTAILRHAAVAKCRAYTLRAVVPHAKGAILKVVACSSGKKTPGATAGKSAADVVFGQSVRIVGHGFKGGESLTVTFTANGQNWTRHTRASSTGSFAVDLGSPSVNSCDQYTLKVVGSSGSRFSSTHDAVPC